MMELKTNCLLCRVAVESYMYTGDYVSWIEDVTLSVCQILQLDQCFQPLLETAVYCNSCLFTLRDMDFTLKNVNTLQKRLENSRLRISTLLETNYDEVSSGGSESILGLANMDNNEDENQSYDYDQVVTSIWEALSADKEPALMESNNNTFAEITTRSSPMIRHRHQTILVDEQGRTSNTDSDSDYYPDIAPKVEIHIGATSRLSRSRKNSTPLKLTKNKTLSERKKDLKARQKKSKEIKFKCNFAKCKFSTSDAVKYTKHLNKHEDKANVSITAIASRLNLKLTNPDSDGKEKKSTKKRSKTNTTKKQGATKKYLTEKKFTCTFENCKFRSDNEARFRVHCRIHEGDETPHHCETCNDAKYATHTALYYHQRQTCPANAERLKRKNTIRTPISGDGQRRPYFRIDSETDEDESGNEDSAELKPEFKCTYEGCLYLTTTVRRYQCHIRVHEGDPLPYWCNSCDKKFPKAKHLNLHKHRNCGDVFTCPTPNCDSVFPNRYAVKAHMSTFHYNDGKHICHQCSKVFESSEEEFYKEHLRTHEVRETDGRKFSCIVGDCDAIFLNSIDLKAHVLDQHETTSSKCDVCQAVLANPTSLKRHTLEQHGPPNYSLKCEQCPFVAKHPSGLKIHMSKHSETKRYVCKVEGCDKEFTWPNSLRTHMMNHTGVRKFKCTFENCTKAFVSSTKLRDHEETHSDRRSYICDLCAKAFKAKKNLKQHFRYVHNVGVTRVKENRQKRKLLEQGEGSSGSSGQKPKTKKKIQSASKYVMNNPSYQQESDSAEDQEMDEDSLDRSTVEVTLGSGNWSFPQQYSGAHGQQFLNPLFHPMNNSSLYFNN